MTSYYKTTKALNDLKVRDRFENRDYFLEESSISYEIRYIGIHGIIIFHEWEKSYIEAGWKFIHFKNIREFKKHISYVNKPGYWMDYYQKGLRLDPITEEEAEEIIEAIQSNDK